MPAETDPAGAALPRVPFTMAARMRRVVAECPPWVRRWRSCKRTRRRKTRESELGGVAPKVCSQTRRKLAKSKPSRTTFRPNATTLGADRKCLPGRVRDELLSVAGRLAGDGETQLKQSPENPGRFTLRKVHIAGITPWPDGAFMFNLRFRRENVLRSNRLLDYGGLILSKKSGAQQPGRSI